MVYWDPYGRSLIVAPPGWLEHPSYDAHYRDLAIQYTYTPPFPTSLERRPYTPPLQAQLERRPLLDPPWPSPTLPAPLSLPSPTPRPATASDATRYGIPLHYNLAGWDPSQPPLVLLERVYDTYQFSRWLMDTSVLVYGPVSMEATLAYEFSSALAEITDLLSWARRGRVSAYERGDILLVDSLVQILGGGNELWLEIGVLVARCERSMLLWARGISDPLARQEWLFFTGGPEFVIRLLGTRETQRGRRTFDLVQRVKAWVEWTREYLQDIGLRGWD